MCLTTARDSGDVQALRRAVAVTAAYLPDADSLQRWMSLRSLPGEREGSTCGRRYGLWDVKDREFDRTQLPASAAFC